MSHILSQNKFKFIIGIAFLFTVAVSYLIYARYITMGLASNEVVRFVVLLNMAFIVFIVSYFRYQRLINPISIYLIFVALFFYSTLPLSNALVFSEKLVILIILSILSYFIGVLIPYSKRIISFPVFSNQTKVLFFRSLIFISIASFSIEIIQIGYIPILRIFDNMDLYGDSTESMTILHTFVLLAPIIFFWCLEVCRKGMISKLERNILLVIFGFIFINNFGRTSLLMFFITGIVYLEYYNKLNNRKLLLGVVSFFLLFIVMGSIRSGTTGDLIKQVLRNIARTEYETSMLESYFIAYSSVNFYKMNEVIEVREEINDFSYGANAAKPVMKLIGYNPKIIRDNAVFDSQGRLTTYLSDPYVDFGFLGIVFFNLLYGITSSLIFRRFSQQASPEYIISWSLMIFCLSMAFFFNAFNTMLVWVIYISNKIILKT